MKAVGLSSPGAELALMEMDVPQPAEGEVLVRIEGSSINPADVYIARGSFASSDLTFPVVPGFDFTGVVEEVGEGVGGFSTGDAVMGCWSRPVFRNGAWAQYVALPVDTAIVHRPDGLSPEQAAAMPLAALTATLMLDDAQLEQGETVLVVGAAGAVGNYVVQLAARRGANVIATAKSADTERIRALGAAQTIDYTAVDIVEAVGRLNGDGLPVLIDIVNDRPELNRLCELVSDGGRVSSARFAVDRKLLSQRSIAGKNVAANNCGPEPLAPLVALADTGELQVMVSSVHPLDDLPAAVEEFEHGSRGKIVITV